MLAKKLGFRVFLGVLVLLPFSLQANACVRLTPENVLAAYFSVGVLKKGPLERVLKPLTRKPLRKIALTFDDGPDGINTPQILDILAAEKIKATFFVIGQKVEWYPEVTSRIFNDGHLLANHSHTHLDLTTLTNEAIIKEELDRASTAVSKITGYYPKIMRPPYGALRTDSVQFLNSAHWHIVRWSLDTFDWDKTRNDPQAIMDRITKQHHPNAIILMHCNGKETIEVLPTVINTLRDLGYEFVTVSQLLDFENYEIPLAY